jgi:hypothetical protein
VLVSDCEATGIDAGTCLCLAANFTLGESRAVATERCGA